MQQSQQETKAYDWSKIPAIADYPEDTESAVSPRIKLQQIAVPMIVSFCSIPLLFYFHPHSWWWSWLGTALLCALFLRAILTDSLRKDKVVPFLLFICSIGGWWVLPGLLPGWFGSFLWTNLLWPLIWPPLLGILAGWLNTRSALLPWWWPWFRTGIIVALLIALSFFAGTLVASRMGILLFPFLPAKVAWPLQSEAVSFSQQAGGKRYSGLSPKDPSTSPGAGCYSRQSAAWDEMTEEHH